MPNDAAAKHIPAVVERFAGQRPVGLKVVVYPGNGCMSGFVTGMFPDPGTEIEGVFTAHTPDNVVAGHIVERVRKGLAEAVAVVGLSGPVVLGDVNGRDDPLDSPVFLPGRLAVQGRPSSRTTESFRG